MTDVVELGAKLRVPIVGFIFGSEAGVFDVEVRTVTITAKKTDLFIMQPLFLPSDKLVLEK